jgi:hypothetical protein
MSPRAKPAAPARIGFEGLLARLERRRAELRTPGELDRRPLLLRLARELGVSEEALLRAGFDKAYRRMVEGL